MANPIKIGIASDTRDFVKGVKSGIIEPLERVQDALEDVEKDGKDAGDKLEKGFKGAQKETEEARKEFDKLGKEIDQAGRKGKAMGDDIKAGADKGARAADEASDEIKSEFKSNLSEVTSSFDGSIQSVGDLVQGTLGGLVSSLGPVGLAAGAAGALGVGILMAAFDSAGERSEEFKAKVSDITAELIEVGATGTVSLEFVNEKLEELATTGDEAGRTLRDIAKLADGGGQSFKDLTQAFLGNEDALERQIDAAKDTIKQYDTMAAAAAGDTSQLDGNLNARYRWAGQTVKALEEVKRANAEARENERLYIEAGGPELEAKAERTETYASSITDSLDDAGESWTDYQDKETGALNLDAYNANIEARITSMTNYQANLSTIQQTISEEAYNYLVSLGADAAPLLQAYADAPLDQKERTATNWGTLGNAASAEYTAKLKAGIPGEVAGPVVKATVDSSAVDDYIAGLPKKRLPGPTFFMKSEPLGGPTG